MNQKRILVLMGGTSEEREVSLKSGLGVLTALRNKGFTADGMDLQVSKLKDIEDYKPDLVFLALHGKNGEDGTIQGMLEIMGIPYTGSGVAASAMCMNKIITKKILSYEGIPTASYIILKRKDFVSNEDGLQRLLSEIGLPMVIKATTQGSAIGTYIVRNEADIQVSIESAFKYDEEILVEKYIKGIELTVSIVGNENPQVLPIIEIVSENDFYDYEAKYTPGKSTHIIPARINDSIKRQVVDLSERAYQAMGCRGFARVDFMLDIDGNPYVLELNTIPGMTETSLFPDAGRAEGISWEDMVQRIVELGLEK